MDNITMSKKERNQLRVFDQLKAKIIKQKQAGKELSMSTRQIRRKYKRWLKQGDKGIVHYSRGVSSKRKWSQEEEAISILKQPCYAGFGPTLAREKLEEKHGIKVSVETLRKALLKAGLFNKQRKRSKHRRWRKPRENCGSLVQMDGSEHLWFEDRGPMCTIYDAVDDATGELMDLRFVPSESTKSIMQFLKDYLKKYGRPEEVYVDCHGTWRVNSNNQEEERLTQIGRAMKELNIHVIYAKSPQAKGRVERMHRTLQDRLVKELRLAGISTIDEANKFAQEIFIPQFNKKFNRRTLQTQDMHRSIDGFDLNNILSIQEERVVQNDFTVLYERRVLQIERNKDVVIRPKNLIKIHEHLDGSLELFLRNIKLSFKEVAFRIRKKLSPVEHVNLNKSASIDDDGIIDLTKQEHLFPFLGKQNLSPLKDDYAPCFKPTSLLQC